MPDRAGSPLNGMAAALMKRRSGLLYIFIPLLLTVIVFSGILGDSFTNWDDDAYVISNPLIRSLSFANICTIFSPHSLVSGCYHPLTILTYAANYALGGLNPGGYALVSLLLHLVNVLLVFLFIRKIARNDRVASICALLFGIHPLHVESVAWISDRKDLLCTAFYLLALLQYLDYVAKTGRARVVHAISVFLLFLLALLSKSAAITLPLALLLIDFHRGRKFSLRTLGEKLPLVALAILIGILAITGQRNQGSFSSAGTWSLLTGISVAGYSLLFYVIKFFLPVKLSAFYPYPSFFNGQLGFPYFLLPLAFAGAAAFLVLIRRNRVVFFGSLFFLINVVFILHFIPVADVITADRFTYLSYIGLSFIAAWYMDKALSLPRRPAIVTGMAGACMALLLCYASQQRCLVWNNSISLWSSSAASCPSAQAYTVLGSAYSDAGEYGAAIRSLDEAVMVDSGFVTAWFNRGWIRAINRRNRSQLDTTEALKSIADLKRVIAILHSSDRAKSFVPTDFKPVKSIGLSYYYIGHVLSELGRLDEALENYRNALETDPSEFTAWCYIVQDLMKVHRPDLAAVFFRNALERAPLSLNDINRIFKFFLETGYNADALVAANKALALAESQGQAQMAFEIRNAISAINSALQQAGEKLGAGRGAEAGIAVR